MIYTKLPVVLLSILTSEKDGSTNHTIANYILEHLDNIQNMGIQDLARQCHVANSSISRFCKDIGLSDFFELKEIIQTNHLYFQQVSLKANLEDRMADYHDKIKESIDLVTKSIDANQLVKLAVDIHNYKKVAIFGLLKSETVAMNLQTDLLMLGKHVYTKVSYQQQMQYIKEANEEDLIIILSYTGIYFDYYLRRLPKTMRKPKIYLITSAQEKTLAYINEILSFSSLQDQASHPYQLQYIASLIAQEYAYLIQDRI